LISDKKLIYLFR